MNSYQILLIISFATIAFADDIKKISTCIAELDDGKRFDLTSLANQKTFK